MMTKKLNQFSLRSFIVVTIVLGTGLGVYLSRSTPGLVELTSDNFDKIALSSKRPVLVAFRADWCGPCRDIHPHLEELAVDLHRKAIIATVDIDDQPKLAARFKVSGIPAFFVFRDGQIVVQQMGGGDKDELAELIAP